MISVDTLAALSLPALVLLILVIAVLEGLWVWITGLGVIPWLRKRTGRSITTAVLTDFSKTFDPGKQTEIEQHAAEDLRTDEQGSGAPPREPEDAPDNVGRPLRPASGIDLASGVVYLEPSREKKDPDRP